MEPDWLHPATLVRVIDGDTFVMKLDLGTYTKVKLEATPQLRLNGIDVYEARTPEGDAATQYVKDCFDRTTQILVKTYKYNATLNRQAADIWLDGIPLAIMLRAAGYEKPAK